MRTDSTHRRPRGRDERGYVLATAALVMVPLILAVGFATDLGYWYTQANKIQRAADAAALAGVVWLPDVTTATNAALASAKRNGFDVADPDVDVTVRQIDSRRLEVTITEGGIDVFFTGVILDEVDITRTASAEYSTAVPLGSPRNYFGTGDMVSGAGREGLWASINGWCTPREQGDPFAPGFINNWSAAGGSSTMVCPFADVNPEHKAEPQYRYQVEVPTGRPQPIVIHLFDPRPLGAIDDRYGTGTTTSFTFRAPDGTPFNNTDNPLATCSGAGEQNPKTFAAGAPTPGEPAAETLLGRAGWIRTCTIATTAPAGTYFIDVATPVGLLGSLAPNNYALLASYGGTGAICDSRTDALCPRLSALDWMSIKAQAGAASASFYLAEIDPTHSGKQMEITLFDPGEGGNTIQILDPAGAPVEFDWRSLDGDYSGDDATALDVSGCSGWPQIGPGHASQCRFNDRFVSLTVDLPTDYATRYPTDNWWRIHYNFSSSVTDRTTWSVKILGDPVHLVS